MRTLLVIILLVVHATAEVCVDYFGSGYFSSKSYQSGLPSTTFVHRPTSNGAQTLDYCELEDLHEYCVARINQYRAGELKFSDGTSDSNVLSGLVPFNQASGAQRCSSESALGDLVAQGGKFSWITINPTVNHTTPYTQATLAAAELMPTRSRA